MSMKWQVIEFKAEAHSIKFLITRAFGKQCEDVLSKEEKEGLFNYLAANPAAGKIIPGASGIRKIRWKAKGGGKRGGARVIYYFRDLNMPLLLLQIYAKGDIIRLSEKEMEAIEKLMKEIVNWFAAQNKGVRKTA